MIIGWSCGYSYQWNGNGIAHLHVLKDASQILNWAQLTSIHNSQLTTIIIALDKKKVW